MWKKFRMVQNFWSDADTKIRTCENLNMRDHHAAESLGEVAIAVGCGQRLASTRKLKLYT